MKTFLVRKSFLIASAIAIFVSSAVAQEKAAKPNPRITVDLNYGVPLTFFSINSGLVAQYTIGARYSFTQDLNAGLRFNAFGFGARTGNAAGALSATPYLPSDVISYNTKFRSLNLVLQYNLNRILGMQPSSKYIPFVSVGGGYTFLGKYGAYYIDGKGVGNPNYQTSPMWRSFQLGGGVRYYLNSFVDLTAGTEFNYNESYWLDATNGDKKLDNYLNTYVGVNLKIGASRSHNLLDWKEKDEPEEIQEKVGYSRFTGEAHLGLPIMFTTIGYSPSLGGGLNGKYSFSRAFALQGSFGWYKYRGSNGSPLTTPVIGLVDNDNIKKYDTWTTLIGMRGVLNLNQLGEKPNTRRTWNHYVSAGAAVMNLNTDFELGNGSSIENAKYRWKTQTYMVGYQAKKYITSEYDFMTGIDIHYNSSYWLDAAPKNEKLDNSVYLYAGVSYKIGAKGGKEHLDWSYSGYNWSEDKKVVPLEQVPVIDKPVVVEEPKEVPAPKQEAPAVPAVKEPEPTPAPAPEPAPAPAPAPAPKAVEPSPAPAPAPKAVEPAPKPVTPKPTPAPKAEPAPVEPSGTYEPSESITPPPMKYNVIVGCYSVTKESVARAAKAKLETKGFTPSLYLDGSYSRMLRLAIISTDNKQEAMDLLRRARKEVDANSWIHLYNKQ